MSKSARKSAPPPPAPAPTAPVPEPAPASRLERWVRPRSRVAEYALDFAGLVALFALVGGPYLLRVFESALPGGWDGVAHYAIADVYARRIFPALSGWTPEYFAGMPFPNFYPPLFYFTVALLTKLGPSTATAFWTVQTVASAAVPPLTYLCGRRLSGSRVGGLVAGVLAVGYLCTVSPLRSLGISLHSTFDAGLSTQLLAHVFTLAFYFTFLDAERSRASAALSALFLGLVALTNVHVVWVAAFLFLGLAVARLVEAKGWRAKARSLGLHFVIGVGSLLVSAVWVLPMLMKLKYVPTQALETPEPGAFVYAFLRLGAYFVFGALAAAVRRDGRALALVGSLALMLVFTLLPTVKVLHLESLAIQQGRIVVAFPFFMTCLVGYLVARAGDVWKWPNARLAVGVLCALVFFSHFKREKEPTGNITAEQAEDYERVLRALNGRTDGRVLVEMGGDGLSDPFGLQSLVGSGGGHSLTTVFRESALNVFFANPLRNSFSVKQETFGIDGKVHAGEYVDQPLEQQVARLRFFNVQYLAVSTATVKERLTGIAGLKRETPAGRWELYSFSEPAPGAAVVPAWAPVLTFAGFSVKPRPDYGFDFVRLGEEAFRAGRLDTPLVLSRAGALDAEADWERFQTVLVTDYRYRDEDAAYAALERFSQKKHVVLLASADPLFERLEVLSRDRDTVHVVTGFTPQQMEEVAAQLRLGDSTITAEESLLYARRLSTREVAVQLLDAVEKVRVPLTGAPRVVKTGLEGNHTTVKLSAAPSGPLPVWVKQGYFPNWRSAEGEPVYLAYPTFQLTFTKQPEVRLAFEHDAVEWVAGALSLLGLAGILAALWRGRRAPAPVA